MRKEEIKTKTEWMRTGNHGGAGEILFKDFQWQKVLIPHPNPLASLPPLPSPPEDWGKPWKHDNLWAKALEEIPCSLPGCSSMCENSCNVWIGWSTYPRNQVFFRCVWLSPQLLHCTCLKGGRELKKTKRWVFYGTVKSLNREFNLKMLFFKLL